MRWRRLASICALALLGTLLSAPAARASVLPTGFSESVVWSGLTNPTNIEFAADGHIFVAEKSGLIKVFDSQADPTPDVFADLRANVHDFWDRGMLGLAVHPNSRPARMSMSSTPMTHLSAGPRRPGATPAPTRRERPATAAWSRGGCRA